MAAPKKNAYYLLRANHGRDFEYKTLKEFTEACVGYFEWCDNNPFKEEQVFHSQGHITRTHIKKMRPYTLKGLCSHIDISVMTFMNYEATREDFIDITTRVRQIIENQQYEGAAAGFLKENIVARQLGLADKQEVKAENENSFKEAPVIQVIYQEGTPKFARSEEDIDIKRPDA